MSELGDNFERDDEGGELYVIHRVTAWICLALTLILGLFLGFLLGLVAAIH